MSTGPAAEVVRPTGGTLVIFGASGDLTKRKLVPALYNLARKGHLGDDFRVVGVARAESSDEAFRSAMADNVRSFAGQAFEEGTWSWLEGRLHYHRGNFDDADTYSTLGAALRERNGGQLGNVLFYLATAPSYFGTVVRELHAAELVDDRQGARRVVVEKPFGRDLASARELNATLLRHLREEQVYRIDHYLGKETVQNLLVFRFSNGIFEPIWNRRYVNHVQITVAETLGVEGRGGYYETSGALRDMVPNHIFQLVSLVAMEPPISFDADAVRDEQTKVIRAIKELDDEDVLRKTVRGQYGAGTVGERELPDYREEERVAENSSTETYVGMKLEIDNWRWKDVPFYLRVGKALPERVTEITVQFRRPPHTLFRDTPVESLSPNELVINVQPTEGITLRFGAKVPGASMRIGTVDMDFCYSDHFGREQTTGYERLLYDALHGDPTLFQRADTVEAAWKVVQPILDVWSALPPRDFPNYAAGSWGPDAAAELLERDGRRWHDRTQRGGC